MIKRAWMIAGIALFGALIACTAPGQSGAPTKDSTSLPLPSPIAAATATTAGGCTWDGTVEVYADSNANGQRDPDETFQPGIRVVSLYKGQPDPYIDATTGADGSVKVGGPTTKCDLSNFQLTLQGLPAGYRISSKNPLALSEANEGGVLDFGIAPEGGAMP